MTSMPPQQHLDLGAIRKIAALYALSQASALGDIPAQQWREECERLYNQEVARLLDIHYPPYQPLTLGQRFMKCFDSLFK